MCDCKDVEMGSYSNSYSIQKPFGRKNYVNIDKCLMREVLDLWEMGIETTGCCCGHNKVEGYIGVEDEFIPKMKELGYEVHHNACRPNDEDSFKPKSLYG